MRICGFPVCTFSAQEVMYAPSAQIFTWFLEIQIQFFVCMYQVYYQLSHLLSGCGTLLPRTLNKHLITPDRKPVADKDRDNTKVEVGEPLCFIMLISMSFWQLCLGNPCCLYKYLRKGKPSGSVQFQGFPKLFELFTS